MLENQREKSTPTKEPNIELLMKACHQTYEIPKLLKQNQKDNIAEYVNTQIQQNLEGYRLVRYDHKNHIFAIQAENNPKAPIIIAFRGTNPKSRKDLYADAHIFFRGTIGRKRREECLKFCTDIANNTQYQDCPFVFCGHSLGGNLAQDCAIGVLAQNDKKNIDVRTFNTAPMFSETGEDLFAKKPELLKSFLHYRLGLDPISPGEGVLAKHQQNTRGIYGNIYSFSCPRFWTHDLSSLQKWLPANIQNQTVGKADPRDKEICRICEEIECLKNATSARYEGRFFILKTALLYIFAPSKAQAIKEHQINLEQTLNAIQKQLTQSTQATNENIQDVIRNIHKQLNEHFNLTKASVISDFSKNLFIAFCSKIETSLNTIAQNPQNPIKLTFLESYLNKNRKPMTLPSCFSLSLFKSKKFNSEQNRPKP